MLAANKDITIKDIIENDTTIDKSQLSEAIKRLLSSDNKHKSLGEVSEELNQYIIMIKDLVDQKEISLDDLKYEIAKYLRKDDKIIPGSLAQLLVGCVGSESSCPMKEEHPEDVPFAYNHSKGNLVPLSSFKRPITDNTYAVLYITGDPQKIKLDSLKSLEDKGFKKIKVHYKNVDSANYTVFNVDNLKKYIHTRSKDGIFQDLMVIGFIMFLVIIIYKISHSYSSTSVTEE
jgi:hypothetical protein